MRSIHLLPGPGTPKAELNPACPERSRRERSEPCCVCSGRRHFSASDPEIYRKLNQPVRGTALASCLFGKVAAFHDDRLVSPVGTDCILHDFLNSPQHLLCARIIGAQFFLSVLRSLARLRVCQNLPHLPEEFPPMRDVLFLRRIESIFPAAAVLDVHVILHHTGSSPRATVRAAPL